MADKFSTLYKSITDTLQNDNIKDKKVMITTILQPQTLTSLKKLCGKKYLKISGCTSQKVVGTTTKKKNIVLSLIINHLFPSSELIPLSKPPKPSKPPEPEPEPESKTDVKQLRRELRYKGIRHNLTALTNNDEDKLKELLTKDRCTEETDYSNCPDDESCHIKNEVCIDKNIKSVRKMERRPIIKNGRTFYVLTTEENAKELQQKINQSEGKGDDTIEYVKSEIVTALDKIMNENDDDIKKKELKQKLNDLFPSINPKFINYVMTDHLIDQGFDLKPKNFDMSESIFIEPEEPEEPELEELEEPVGDSRYDLFLQEGMKKVKEDGNCYFRCLSALLKLSYGVDVDHKKCRRDIVKMIDIMYRNDENFKKFFDAINDSFDSYLIKMNSNKEWAGEVEIMASCILYNININIVTERVDSSGNIIPNIMFNPKNLKFRHMSENIMINDKYFNKSLIWCLYHVGDDDESGNHYNYNHIVLENDLSFLDTFNPTKLQIPIYDKSNFYESWLSEYYNRLTYTKLELSDFDTELYDPEQPYMSREVKLTKEEEEKLKGIIEQVEKTKKQPSPLAEPSDTPDKTASIMQEIRGILEQPTKYEQPSPLAEPPLEPSEPSLILGKSSVQTPPRKKKKNVMKHPGFRKSNPTQSGNKKLQDQIQKLLELPKDSSIEEITQIENPIIEETTDLKSPGKQVADIMSKFQKGIV